MDRARDKFYGTTIVCARRDKKVAIGGDGQVTLGNSIMKGNAKKIRRLYKNSIITGFAGAVADAITLYEKIEKKLESYSGNLMKASVELTKEWRMDRYLRRLEAMLIVADKERTLLISGNGEVFEPEESVIAIGSGGDFAKSAALALVENTDLTVEEIVKKSLTLASKICIYTNQNITIEKL